jgi:hypothetical protein
MNVTYRILRARRRNLRAVLAALLVPGLAVLAESTVVYRDIEDVPLLGHPSVFYDLDFDEDGATDVTFRAASDFDAIPGESSRILAVPAVPPDQGGFVWPLGPGESIGPVVELPLSWENPGEGRLGPIGLTFTSCRNTGFGLVCLGLFTCQNAYMGVQFHIDGQPHYGWVRVDCSLGGVNGGLVTEYAYETRPGVPIKAGAKPVVVPMFAPRVARDGYLRLKWPTDVGKAYQVQTKTRMDALRWTNLGFVIPATSTETMVDLPMEAAAEFFRVIEAD